jgi:signal transduction histidine kinase
MIIQNTLHGSEIETKQPIPDFKIRPVFNIISECYKMFKGEADDKELDIDIKAKIGDRHFLLNSSELENKTKLYEKLLYNDFVAILAPKEKDKEIYKTISAIIVYRGDEINVPLVDLPFKCSLIMNRNDFKGSDIKIYAKLLERKIELKPDNIKDAYFPDIEMSPEELALAFKNLFQNAIKYSFISIKNRKRRFIEITIEIVDKYFYKITISNFGVGIHKDELKDLIWKPRYRGIYSRDRNRTGAGLGLTNAKRIIEKTHNGKIWAESYDQTSGFKNVFSVMLPIRQEYSELLNKRWKE